MLKIRHCPVCNSKNLSKTEKSIRCKKCGWISSNQKNAEFVEFKEFSTGN